MGLRVKVGKEGESVIIMIALPADKYERLRRGVMLLYGCSGDGKASIARYIAEALNYLETIRSCTDT